MAKKRREKVKETEKERLERGVERSQRLPVCWVPLVWILSPPSSPASLLPDSGAEEGRAVSLFL